MNISSFSQIEQLAVETINETEKLIQEGLKPEKGGEKAIQLQMTERDECGYPIIQMDRAMIGQIALDIRPPAVQPKDLMASLKFYGLFFNLTVGSIFLQMNVNMTQRFSYHHLKRVVA